MIGRKTLVVFLNTVLGGVLGLVAMKAIGYWMDVPEIVGSVAYAIGILGLFYFLTDLGIGQAHVKRVSEGLDEGDCFATFFVFKIAATSAFVLVGLVFYAYKTFVDPSSFTDLDFTVFFFILAYYALMSFRLLFVSTFDAHLEVARGQLVVFFDTVVRVALTLAVVGLYAAIFKNTGPLLGLVDTFGVFADFVRQNPAGALAATYTAGLVVSLGAAFLSWRQRGVGMGRFRWDIMKGYWVYALPLFLLLIVDTVSAQIDRVTLGFFATDRELGIFDLPRRFTQLVQVIPFTVAGLLFPSISALEARGDLDTIREKLRDSVRYISLLVLPAVTFLALFPGHLIRIFIGNAWLPGATAFSLLVLYAFVIGMMRPYYSLITGMGHSGLAARAGSSMAVSNLVLNVVLIPGSILGVPLAGLGMTGAALATLLSGVVGFTFVRVASRSLVGPVPVPHFFRHVAAAATMGLLLRLLDLTLLPLVRWYHLPMYAILGAVIYFIALALLRALTRKDVNFFFEVVNLRAMFGYMREELTTSRKDASDDE